MTQVQGCLSAREASFLAVTASSRGQCFAEDYLGEWKVSARPSRADFHLAKAIAYGSIQMATALDYLAKQLTATGKLNLKLTERILLRCALYQAHFMDHIPIYAIVDESVQLAHKYCHRRFVPFLNATLRAYSSIKPTLPSDDSIESLAIRYSYPSLFVEAVHKSVPILACGNRPSPLMVRLRNGVTFPANCTNVLDKKLRVARLDNPQDIESFIASKDYYVQNATQVYLLDALANLTPTPKSIIDLCAAPGGKTIAIHDLYPSAQLTVNDISPKRVKTLQENLSKYDIQAAVMVSSGEAYQSNETYDLIILDVPCSNSGVLNKRSEARWRLAQQELQQLNGIQLKLVERARQLLAPGGTIWYLTCSILPQENEELIAQACQRYGLKSLFHETVLPNAEGWDGGFGCLLIPHG